MSFIFNQISPQRRLLHSSSARTEDDFEPWLLEDREGNGMRWQYTSSPGGTVSIARSWRIATGPSQRRAALGGVVVQSLSQISLLGELSKSDLKAERGLRRNMFIKCSIR